MFVTELSSDSLIQLNGTKLYNATGEVVEVEDSHHHHEGDQEEEEVEQLNLEDEDLNLEDERFLQHPYRSEDIGTYR